ncbi:MAG: hypothetical protein WAO52_01890 [Prolixibacteraceae bacterium]
MKTYIFMTSVFNSILRNAPNSDLVFFSGSTPKAPVPDKSGSFTKVVLPVRGEIRNESWFVGL